MKKLLFILLLLSATYSNAQVAINQIGTAPNPNSMLDVSSNTKGVLIPRFTTTDRTNLSGSLTTNEDGLTVYDTDTKSFWYWNGTSWAEITSASNAQDDKDWFVAGTTNAPTDINDDMYHMGNVAIGKNTADYKLDIYDNTKNNVLYVKQDNTDDSQSLRIAGTFISEGPAPTSTGKIGVYTGLGGNAGNGNNYASLTGYETDINISGNSNKHAYGFVSDITGNNDGSQIGNYNYLHDTGGNGARYGVLNYMQGSSNGTIYGYYNLLNYSGDGINFGHYYRIAGSGNGVQYGGFNRILNSGTGKQIGTVNEIKNNGGAIHVGTLNSVGAGVTENDPSTLVPITNDSDGKRVGAINVVAGNGGGIHVAEGNAVFSTGNGLHIGMGNSLGYDAVNNQTTNTTGRHVGVINTLSDTGNASHVGTVNALGAYVTAANPTTPIPVSGDSDAKRIGSTNVIMGDGGGDHLGEINNIISTGNGKHIGINNIIGYNYLNNTATNTTGDHFGTVNNLNDQGSGKHIGTFNALGLNLVNNQEVDSNGIQIGGMNLLVGGNQSGTALQGPQIGQINVLTVKSDVSNPIIQGKQYGTINVIGRDFLNPFGPTLNNGDGDHFATYNEVADTGNGVHIASYNKVGKDGTGAHIAVLGEVDATDATAMAGVFKGYTTSNNQVSTINLWSASEYVVNINTNSDLNLMEAGFNPTLYNKMGMVEVKVFVRVSNATGNGNKFRLHAVRNGGDSTPITDTDTWTWTNTSTGKYIIESQWKTWNAGTNIWELHLYGITDGSSTMKITNVYVMIRPLQ